MSKGERRVFQGVERGQPFEIDVDGEKVAEGYIPKTQPFAYSGDEGVDVGTDNETNVTNDYKEGDNAFTGKINKVIVDIGVN